ncbi:SAM-dependent methyltransferase [Nocardia sp. alder85J]|uniref:SAM-dependent methyltransferase n=1 Tax=Nocardia sp. alder85J TaxID=2862949 RepID=UPI001CD71E3B|nr:SAM-dependent methyltransferase [Nocardia sp. alder85J]MCX4094916.1 SAM-dependent methyltransferase [Nocardia sp. alder85J]
MQPLLPDWAADDIDPRIPSPARVYDHLLGGFANFDVDRRIAAKMIEVIPEVPRTARANRAFLQRAVGYLAAAGVDQYLDLGSGIPTAGNVHEIAQAVNPAARVVYVDVDPVAVTMSRRLLAGNPNATAVHGDFTDVDAVLVHPQISGLLDFSRPIAVLLVSVLHFVHDDAAAQRIFARLREVLAPGSHVALSHLTREGPAEQIERMLEVTRQVTGRGDRLRTRAEILELLGDLEPIDPGLVHLARWRPDPDQPLPELHPLDGFAAVAVKH